MVNKNNLLHSLTEFLRRYRPRVNGRPSRLDDAPEPVLTKYKAPAYASKVDAVVGRYILRHHSNLMTKLECQVQAHLEAKSMMNAWSHRSPVEQAYISAEWSGGLSTDPVVLELAEDGYEVFAERTATRILGQYGDQLKLNRCPNCACIARTQTARQCRICGCDWHPR